MLKYNKYANELGYLEKDFPFVHGITIKNLKEDENHYYKEEFFNLDMTLAMMMYGYLKEFNKVKVGHPMSIESDEEWTKIIDKMAEGFGKYTKKYPNDSEYDEIVDSLEESIDLLKKYFVDLWY